MRNATLLQFLDVWITDNADDHPDGAVLAEAFRDWLAPFVADDQGAALRAFQDALETARAWDADVADAAARIVAPTQKRAASAWSMTFARDNVPVEEDFNGIIAGIAIFEL